MKHLRESILTSIGQGDSYLRNKWLEEHGLDPKKAIWRENKLTYKGDIYVYDVQDDELPFASFPYVFHKLIGEMEIGSCKIKNLKGCPEIVEGAFRCLSCNSLETLEGGPKEVLGWEYCCNCCDKLKSLKGAPEKIFGNFSLSECPELKSLTYFPKEIGGNFEYWGCGKQFSEKEIRRRCNLKGYIEGY